MAVYYKLCPAQLAALKLENYNMTGKDMECKHWNTVYVGLSGTDSDSDFPLFVPHGEIYSATATAKKRGGMFKKRNWESDSKQDSKHTM